VVQDCEFVNNIKAGIAKWQGRSPCLKNGARDCRVLLCGLLNDSRTDSIPQSDKWGDAFFRARRFTENQESRPDGM
jgi:hypothetical protein